MTWWSKKWVLIGGHLHPGNATGHLLATVPLLFLLKSYRSTISPCVVRMQHSCSLLLVGSWYCRENTTRYLYFISGCYCPWKMKKIIRSFIFQNGSVSKDIDDTDFLVTFQILLSIIGKQTKGEVRYQSC